jgi:hypothetical protein
MFGVIVEFCLAEPNGGTTNHHGKRASRSEVFCRRHFGASDSGKARSEHVWRPCTDPRANGGRVNRYYDPATGQFITVDPYYGGTSNAPEVGPIAVSANQPVTIYQLALGAPTLLKYSGNDPAAGLNLQSEELDEGTSSNTTGDVEYVNVFGLPDVDLAGLSSIAGLPITTPDPPSPTYVGAGFFDPNSVASSDNPYAYGDGDPVNQIDPTGRISAGTICSHDSAAACQAAIKIQAEITTAVCATEPGFCSGRYTFLQICAVVATAELFIPDFGPLVRIALFGACVAYQDATAKL